MTALAHGVRTVIEYLLRPFDLLPPFWGLTLFSIVTGALMLWIVGRVTPQSALARARSRMAAAIYEIRLFLDSPRRIIAAQGRLFSWLLVYLAALAPAFAVLTVPFGLLYLHLDVRYGQAALPVDRPVVVRIDLDLGVDDGDVTVESSTGIAMTAPPLHVHDPEHDPEQNRVYLRLRITEPGLHTLILGVGHGRVTKQLSADPSAASVLPERSRGMDMWWSYGHEAPLDSRAAVRAITIDHPDKPQNWLGIAMPWWLYWFLVTTLAALLLRHPMDVKL